MARLPAMRCRRPTGRGVTISSAGQGSSGAERPTAAAPDVIFLKRGRDCGGTIILPSFPFCCTLHRSNNP